MDEDIRSLERRASMGDPVALAQAARKKLRCGGKLTLAEAFAALPERLPDFILVRGVRRRVLSLPVVDGCLEQVRWSNASGAKNWIATVTATPRGLGGLKREFWERAGQKGWCVIRTGLTLGDYLEVGADDEDGKDRTYYRVLARGDDTIVLREAAPPPRNPPAIVAELDRLVAPDDAAERAVTSARDQVALLRRQLAAAERALTELELAPAPEEEGMKSCLTSEQVTRAEFMSDDNKVSP